MNWSPTEQEIEEKLIELAYAWGDLERRLVDGLLDFDPDPEAVRRSLLGLKITKAFRVEAIYVQNGFGDPCSTYVLLFDVTDTKAREAARPLSSSTSARQDLQDLINDFAHPWHQRDNLIVKVVPRSTPVAGQICRRHPEEHPAKMAPDLSDVPSTKPKSNVGLIERDHYWLTPIEVPFYEALQETGLTFSVQPWVQVNDQRSRLDSLVFYDGGVVAVELDGHESHKTRDQRGKDAKRDRWFAARKITTVRFTGSQIYADPQGCVKELLDVLRAAQARP